MCHAPFGGRWAFRAAAILLGAAVAPPVPAQPPAAGDEELESELETQRRQLEQLGEEMAELRSIVPGRESEGPPAEEPAVRVGGALRLNYLLTDFDKGRKRRGGDSGLELFRLSADGVKGGLRLSAEYRWYPFMDAVHHGWAGYGGDGPGEVRVGIMQVPFGLLPYAAHNYWFGVPYFMGFGDDYDTGIQYLHREGPWDLRAAFFKASELGNPDSLERYSIDVVHGDPGQRNRETNQANLRLAYTLGDGGPCPLQLGASGQWGQLYNADTRRLGEHWAAGGHLDLRCGRWNLQLEGFRYAFRPEAPPGDDDATVTVGGLASSYALAAEGSVGVANLAYNFPVPWPAVDLLTCYNDFSILDKDDPDFRDSMINTTGCAVGAGPLFVYLDVIRARSMVFLGADSGADSGAEPLGRGDAGGWDTRFNINLGYYF